MLFIQLAVSFKEENDKEGHVMAYKKKNLTLNGEQKKFLKNYVSKGVRPFHAMSTLWYTLSCGQEFDLETLFQ